MNFEFAGSTKKVVFVIVLMACLSLLILQNLSTPIANSVFTNLSGKKIALAQLQGKVVIVTFWATDCPNCIKEIPHLQSLYDNYHNKGLEIIAIAMFYDPPSRVVAMTQAKRINYDVALDFTAQHAKEFGQVQLTPTTFLIDPRGQIIFKKVGALDFTEIANLIDNLIKG
jgi:thiol-disulfide isomerase/thioredoxin